MARKRRPPLGSGQRFQALAANLAKPPRNPHPKAKNQLLPTYSTQAGIAKRLPPLPRKRKRGG